MFPSRIVVMSLVASTFMTLDGVATWELTGTKLKRIATVFATLLAVAAFAAPAADARPMPNCIPGVAC